MSIMRNTVFDIQYPKKDTVRVLKTMDDNVVVISLLKADTLPYEVPLADFEDAIREGTAVRDDRYPVAYLPQPTEKQVQAMEKAWDVIGEFVQDEPSCFDKKIRGRFISAKSKETGLQRKRIQCLLYRYWARGMTKHGLYPNYELRGGAGKPRASTVNLGRPPLHPRNVEPISIGEKELGYIEEAIKKYYNKHTKYSFSFAYQKMIEEHYTDPNTNTLYTAYPTENQFRYHAQKYSNPKTRHGNTIYNKDKRGITGSSRSEAVGPGDAYQIDATVADVYLVSRDDRSEVVGRPELYFVVDVFSRMIVGFYACLESASWENARMALLNAFSDKVSFCEKYGIKIQEDDWPCKGIPRELIVDNGELISRASNSIIEGLGITVKNEPSYRPDLKGIVESRFRLLNIKEKARLPGAVLPDFRQRGAPDYRLDAKLTLTEFIKIIIHFVLNHNKRVMQNHPQPLPDVIGDNVPAIPIELWKWGIRHRTGSLKEMPQESLNLALSQRGQASVTKRGIKFHGMFYDCESARAENWFSKARMSGGWKINIAYNPSDPERIYWLNSIDKAEECNRTRDSEELFTGLTMEEIDWNISRMAKQETSYRDVSLQSDIDHNAAINAIVRAAEQKNAILSYEGAKMKAKPKQIRENRRRENERMKAETSALQGDKHEKEESFEDEDMSNDIYGFGKMFDSFANEEEK